MKVYELARELKLKSVELVDKLRKEGGLPVKNHMQSLSPEELNKARKIFKAKTAKPSAVKKTKKTLTRRKKTPAPQPEDQSLPARASLPKKNIIRRKALPQSSKPIEKTDLSEETSPAKTSVKVETAPEQANPLAERLIRPGMVPAKSTALLKDVDDFTDNTGTPEDKKKAKKLTIEKESQNRAFRATDFRKREVIFQPKKKKVSLGLSAKKTAITQAKAHKRIIKMHDAVSIENLSHQMGVKKKTLIAKIKKEGLISSFDASSALDTDSASLIAGLFDFEVKNLSKSHTDMIQSLVFGNISAPKQMKPPVVTVMGHVNHGKTTLLDTIRKTRLASKEAGGITQHIGAYSVSVGKSFVTFIDTPGHSAFTAMRARGVKATDIVVLMVAADDGIQPQTIEAINHAKNAKVPVIAAINKIDASGANPETVKKQLSEHNLVPEEWGGDTIFCNISALKGEGIKELLEHIHLLAEMHELKANPQRSAQGILIENRMSKGRGWVMTLLVQDGTLKAGQTLIAGSKIGRARQMTNDMGKPVDTAGPGIPVEISGFDQPAEAGDVFYAVKDEKTARNYLEQKEKQKQKEKQTDKKLSIEELLMKTHLNQSRTLNLILKTDVIGSQEAVKHSIEKLNTDKVSAKILHAGLGPVNESDVLLASTGKSALLCFNVSVDSKAQKLIREKSIQVKTYKVIYDLLTDVEKMMANLLDPEIQESFGGKAEVLQIFNLSNIGSVAGCKVIEGKIQSKHLARVHRKGQTVHEGRLSSLKRFKQDTKEVSAGQECGIALHGYKDIQTGDIIESFTQIKIKKDKL